MKKYKNGKFIEVSAEEAATIKRRFEKYANRKQSSLAEYEAKIKVLEDSLALVLKQLGKSDIVDESVTDNTVIKENITE